MTTTIERAIFAARRRIAGATVRHGTGIPGDDYVYAQGFAEAQAAALLHLDRAIRAAVGVSDSFDVDALEEAVLSTPDGYRAAIYTAPDGQSETALTGPEHAHLGDEALMAEGLSAARAAGYIGAEYPGIPLEDLRAGMSVDRWIA